MAAEHWNRNTIDGGWRERSKIGGGGGANYGHASVGILFMHVSMLCRKLHDDILRIHDGIFCMHVGILQMHADIGHVVHA